MFTTGSKYFFGLAVFAFVAACVYGGASAGDEVGMDTFMGVLTMGYKGTVGDHFGYGLLMALAGTSAFLGLVTVAFRDGEGEALAQVAATDAIPEATAPSSASYWPAVAGFSVASLVLGVVIDEALFVLGLVGLAIVLVEWAVSAWAERATGDPEVNRSIRNRFMLPVEIPGMAVLGIALFVLSISRILLALPKVGGYVVFGVVPALILAVGWVITTRPKVNPSVVSALLVVGGLAVLGAGVAGAAVGEREFHKAGEEHGGEHGEETGEHTDEGDDVEGGRTGTEDDAGDGEDDAPQGG
jgi:hypothetical protein